MAKEYVSKKWIQSAREKMEREGTTGSFTKYCKSKGFGGVTAECIAMAKKSKDPRIVRKAVFAQNVRK